MDDKEIVALYWARSDTAITETAKKYGAYCFCVAQRILQNREDSEECVNDTYWRAWGAMPDRRPDRLSPFLARITRNLALNRREKGQTEKRGSGQVPLALEELRECIPAADSVERILDDQALAAVLNRFLASLTAEKRQIFLRRYWYLCSIAEIARDCSLSESKVKMSLHRSRAALRQLLEKEGIDL